MGLKSLELVHASASIDEHGTEYSCRSYEGVGDGHPLAGNFSTGLTRLPDTHYESAPIVLTDVMAGGADWYRIRIDFGWSIDNYYDGSCYPPPADLDGFWTGLSDVIFATGGITVTSPDTVFSSTHRDGPTYPLGPGLFQRALTVLRPGTTSSYAGALPTGVLPEELIDPAALTEFLVEFNGESGFVGCAASISIAAYTEVADTDVTRDKWDVLAGSLSTQVHDEPKPPYFPAGLVPFLLDGNDASQARVETRIPNIRNTEDCEVADPFHPGLTTTVPTTIESAYDREGYPVDYRPPDGLIDFDPLGRTVGDIASLPTPPDYARVRVLLQLTAMPFVAACSTPIDSRASVLTGFFKPYEFYGTDVPGISPSVSFDAYVAPPQSHYVDADGEVDPAAIMFWPFSEVLGLLVELLVIGAYGWFFDSDVRFQVELFTAAERPPIENPEIALGVLRSGWYHDD